MRVLKLSEAIEKKMLASRRGSDAAAERTARRIVNDVRRRGDAALFAWTRKFDRLAVNAGNVWVTEAEMKKAARDVSRKYMNAIDHAARNIRAVARRQKPQEWMIAVEPGVRVGQRVRPIESVGCYLPGG